MTTSEERPALRIVRDPTKPAEPVRKPLKIKSFAVAQGWVAWCENLNYSTIDESLAPLPVVGFATIEHEAGDYFAPMVMVYSMGHALVDARTLHGFLVITSPDQPSAIEVAAEHQEIWYRWLTHTSDHRGAEACDCRSPGNSLCTALRVGFSIPDEPCTCGCHGAAFEAPPEAHDEEGSYVPPWKRITSKPT